MRTGSDLKTGPGPGTGPEAGADHGAGVDSGAGVDLRSRAFYLGDFNGALFAFCEMVRRMEKPLALSKPFDPGEDAALRPFVESNTEEFGLKYYLEKELMLTRLFDTVAMDGRWVYLIYRDEKDLDEYFRLKGKEKRLIKIGCYTDEEQDVLAREYAALMGYRKDEADRLIARRQPQAL